MSFISTAGARLTSRSVAEGITQIVLSTMAVRFLGFNCTPYLVDDLLVDTGFAHARAPMMRFLEGRTIRGICCTHHHEDHPGNCGPIARRFGCPVYLRLAELATTEGLDDLPFYRSLFWGHPGPYKPTEMPEQISTSGRTLSSIPTPGHSATHVALFDEEHGIVFTGDLYVSGGVTALMAHEDPSDLIDSLRRIADLEPELMLTGHGLAAPDPGGLLRLKADRMEQAIGRAQELAAEGLGPEEIEGRLFSSGRLRDRFHLLLTGGEFSRGRFIRAALRARSSAEPPSRPPSACAEPGSS